MKCSSVIAKTVISFLAGFVIKPSYAVEHDLPLSKTDEGLAYVAAHNPNATTRVIFIHGSPGSHSAYSSYLTDPRLTKDNELFAVDRLGYGASDSRLVSSIESQAKAILPLLSHDKANVIVGHSLGGPIALSLALQSHDLVSGLVLVAPAFDPSLEEPKWYNIIADSWLVSWALSKDWATSNGEMMPLSQELERLSQQNWNELDSMPVTLIHGVEDTIADPRNSTYARRKLTGREKRLVEVEDQGHFILWQDAPFVSEEILKLIDKLN